MRIIRTLTYCFYIFYTLRIAVFGTDHFALHFSKGSKRTRDTFFKTVRGQGWLLSSIQGPCKRSRVSSGLRSFEHLPRDVKAGLYAKQDAKRSESFISGALRPPTGLSSSESPITRLLAEGSSKSGRTRNMAVSRRSNEISKTTQALAAIRACLRRTRVAAATGSLTTTAKQL